VDWIRSKGTGLSGKPKHPIEKFTKALFDALGMEYFPENTRSAIRPFDSTGNNVTGNGRSARATTRNPLDTPGRILNSKTCLKADVSKKRIFMPVNGLSS
jgi:hypothetical protein